MPDLLPMPPVAPTDPVTEVIHGVTVVDPYRWLENGDSQETRNWLEQQSAYARAYLDSIDGRGPIERRIRELLEITTYDSVLGTKQRYVFRKRLANQEQPCIYVREGPNGTDRLLIDPSGRGGSAYTAVKPLTLSTDGKVLAFETKEGGERTSRVEFLNLDTGVQLPETLPHGYLRGFAFGPDSDGFCYSVEPADESRAFDPVLYQHKIGTSMDQDRVVFNVAATDSTRIGVISGPTHELILVQRALDRLVTDCYVRPHDPTAAARKILSGIDYLFVPQFVGDRVLALTNLDAPNLRIVELRIHPDGLLEFVELVPSRRALIQQWVVVAGHMVVCYLEGTAFKVCIFDLFGKEVGEIPLPPHKTVRLISGCTDSDEVLMECESFFESVSIHRYCIGSREQTTWAGAAIKLDSTAYGQRQVWYESKDGTRVPISIVGRRRALERNQNPVILTSYGGFQTSMTPQFSVFVTFLMERGCLFALPNIRGGGEFGAQWHLAAQRHQRQKAFDDFVSAAEWLIESGIAAADKVAIFGGSNSGLLVGAAMTQAPSLFRAVVCMAPLLDMIRYHLFNGAGKWVDEFGTAERADDFAVLRNYSPYHRISDNVAYPAVMMISGEMDQKCHPLHARKMIARLQAANSSSHPIILDYSKYRGHTPVLPLSVRVRALTDRMAFLCDQLELLR